MEHLSSIIKNLNKEEIRHLKIFSNRINYGKENKTLKLFDYLKEGKFTENDTELANLLYKNGSKNPFYRLKNRLFEDIKKSLLLQHVELDEKISITNLISLANIFSYKTQYEESLHFLKKAEAKALENEYYDLLDLIYSEIISISSFYDKINPLEFIEKQKQNSEKCLVLKQANHAISTINHQLKIINFSGKGKEISKTLQKLLDDLSIAGNVYKIPKFKLKIHECVRNFLLQRKDFEVLEQYLINSMKEFKKENVFSKTTHQDKIILTTWIINTLVKNRKFKYALKYTNVLKEDLLKYNKLYYEKYIWMYYQSLMVNHFFSGDLKKSIETIEKLKGVSKYKGNVFYDLAIHLNLASLYYCSNNLSLAVKNLSAVLMKDIYNSLSPQIKFSISVLEMILHYEKGNFDYAHMKLKETFRRHKEILKSPDYTNESAFLLIFKLLIELPDPWLNTKITNKIKDYIVSSPEIEPGSNEVINYKVWLASKLNKESYYETILKMLKK